MTTANKVTTLRILLIPVFAIELIGYVNFGGKIYQFLSIVSFVIFSILDLVDGFIARHFNQKSELGAILDPLADKLLIATSILVLSFYNVTFLEQIPLWLSGVIIGCDLLLLIGFAVIRISIDKIIVRPHIIGKISTALQLVVILLILLKWDRNFAAQWFTVCAVSAAACSFFSTLIYAWDGINQLRSNLNNSRMRKLRN